MGAKLNRTPIFNFNRSNLVLGGERKIVYGLLLVVIIFVVTLQTWFTFVIGVFLWIVIMPLLRMMANADPDMSRIFKRFTIYQPYYPPQAPKDYSRRNN
jgi:type IV secretory pathway TrbD component